MAAGNETTDGDAKVVSKEGPADENTGDPTTLAADMKALQLTEKHPLQNEWVLWYFKPDKAKKWDECLLKVSQFKAVEDFWALYNHIELASNLGVGCDYNIFKHGIQPMWEDDRNKKGGRWLFVLSKGKGNPNQSKAVDELWLEVLLCLIGEAFGDDSDQICGAVVNVRSKMDKIAVWTSDSKNSKSVMNIGRTLKQRTGVNFQINYEAHADTQVKQGSVAKHTFSV